MKTNLNKEIKINIKNHCARPNNYYIYILMPLIRYAFMILDDIYRS